MDGCTSSKQPSHRHGGWNTVVAREAGGAALSAIGVAAQAGDQDAIKAASDFCLAFDPNNLTAITQSNAAFAKLDPASSLH